MRDMFRLDGQTAVVTGALGTIGQAYCKALAEAGASVAMVDKSSRGADELADALTRKGVKAKYYPIDLTDEQAIADGVERIVADFGQIDILVNHAGMNIRKPALELTLEDWDKVIGLNLRAMFAMAQAVARHMVPRGKGKIINTASVSAVRGHPRLVAYAASKGGVVQMTKVLANEWASHGINVNAIAPGYILTQQTEGFLSDPETMRSIVGKIPMKRLGKPEDLVGGLIYLASSASDYVTGHTLFIEGGRLID
jgi:NAD(P)-dependent dehydrogenase (short-subunit alcohol dehydrogenase family)